MPQNWSRDCGDFYESNKHDIWQASATTRDEKKERAGALFKIYISLMDVQTSTVGTENCDNIEYNEQTILAEWENMHISFGAVQQILAGARAYFASFLFSLSQNLILYARLTSRCLLCKPKLNEHKCLIMRRDSIDI